MGNATINTKEMTPEALSQVKIASDTSLALEERLEAYENIIYSEVGDTDLVRARNIEREVGIRQLFLKFEGGNPTGTQKDRIAFAQVMDALRRGFEGITVATCGNYGVAIAFAAQLAALKCVIHIPENYQTKRIKEMISRQGEIIRVAGDYENAVEVSRQYAQENDVYDANPGGANTDLQLRAYGEIAYEIYDELRDAPWAIAMPTSNGTTLAGVHRGFLSLFLRGKTSRMPHMVGGSSFLKNPIVWAFRKGLNECPNLAPEKIKETKINEPLVNWHSLDGELALKALRETEGWAWDVSDRAMLENARKIREQQGLDVLPAATAGLSALLERHKQQPLPNDRFVVVLTGRKS